MSDLCVVIFHFLIFKFTSLKYFANKLYDQDPMIPVTKPKMAAINGMPINAPKASTVP